MKSSLINTPLGSMLAIADEEALYLLEFSERRELERQIERLCTRHKSTITPGSPSPILSIKKELKEYFDGTLQHFKTPLHLIGSPFQKEAWNVLMTIPYGETRSYAEQAIRLGNKDAARAVANANSNNRLAIVIPCHRIINSNGKLGGYAGGVDRKQWLLNHETKNRS